jgi:hypothetical protein
MKYDWWTQTRIAIRSYERRRKEYGKLPPRQKAEVDAVSAALEDMKRSDGMEPVLNMLEMYHIKQTHTLDGAAFAVGYGHERAAHYNRRFMRLVAIKLGYLYPPSKN